MICKAKQFFTLIFCSWATTSLLHAHAVICVNAVKTEIVLPLAKVEKIPSKSWGFGLLSSDSTQVCMALRQEYQGNLLALWLKK